MTAGYSLDATESEVDEALAVYRDGKLAWAIDLRELAAGASGTPMDLRVLPTAPSSPELPAIVAKSDPVRAEGGEAAPVPRVAAESTSGETLAAPPAALPESG